MTTSWKRPWIAMSAILSLTLGMLSFAFVATPVAAAQATTLENLSGAPVDLHEGTCDDFVDEPAYDGGDVEVATLGDFEDDEFFDDGIFEDDDEGILGVDLDDDDVLDDDEIVGPLDDAALPAAVAETDFGDDVDFGQQYAIVLHAGADDYQTILACGAITGNIDDEGPLVIDLDPVNDSGIFGYSVIEDDGGAIHTYLFERGEVPAEEAAVGSPDIAEGFPVGIHRGTCAEWTTEPAYDVGVMQQVQVAAPGEQEGGVVHDEDIAAIVGDDGILDENDEGFLRDDLDDDGIFEAGIDLNDDDILDDDEVLGEDEDDDGILDADELSVLAADTAFPAAFGTVYKIDTDTQFDGTELIDEGPYIVGVHQSEEEYETLIACGPVVPVLEDENVIVLAKPVEGAETMFAGTFLIKEDEGEMAGYLWPCEPVKQDVEPTPTPVPPTPTPEPTPTPVPSAVVTETEVVKETEVVPAPTATALAEQPGEPPANIIDLGEEPAGPLTAQAGGTLTFNNPADVDRVFRIADLGIEETIPAGESLEVVLPDDVEPGDYDYEVLEDGEVIYGDVLTVE